MVSHQSAESSFRPGVISEAEMKEFDDMCFVGEEPKKDNTTEKPTVMKHVAV